MDFKEIIKSNLEKDKLVLGYNEDKKLICDIKKDSSIIITGETGSGKSILLDQILLELISEFNSLEMNLMLIDTSGVELNYYHDTNYATFSAINDIDKSVVALSRVLKEIETRKNLLNEAKVLTVDEYNEINEINEEKIPLLVVAIDDDKLLLREADVEKMLSGIISQLNGLNILVILATSDVFNKFFETDINTLASLLISFDYTNELESKKNNIQGSQNLSIGEFLARRQGTVEKYQNFDFDDNLIKEVLRID
ncbi:MAG: hypothetical protein J1F35_07230 [Erysipelotrichales bacterium]|nr:hypothetical protein [Erysipelotrichales bacterium]